MALAFPVTSCGKDSTESAAEHRPPEPPAAKKLLFVGLDGADWTYLDPLIASGRLPNFARLVETSASGVLESEPPLLSPIVWTTMMTGRSPLDHRVLDFVRFNAVTGAREPIGGDERRVPAVWEIASGAGKAVAVFGVWATHPAEAVTGLFVSDRFVAGDGEVAQAVQPAASSAWAVDTKRKARQGVTVERLREIVPDATEEEVESAAASSERWTDPLTGVFHLLARTETTRSLATEWLVRNDWDLAIVYFEGTDTIGHLVARYAPPPMAGVDEARYARFHEAPERYFAHMDAIVGELAAIAEKAGAALLIASDHGFEWGEGRPATSSSNDMTAATWHRPEGIYLLHGPGIAPTAGHTGRGKSAAIAATVLSLAGAPPGTKMAPPLAEVVATAALVDYATRKPASPGVVAGAASNETSGQEELARLAALGYLSPADAKSSTKGRKERPYGSRTAGSLSNEAAIVERLGDIAGAARLYAAAVEQETESAAARWNLSSFLFEQGREAEKSDELMFEAVRLGLAEGDHLVVERARRLARAGEPAHALRVLDRAVAERPRSLAPRLMRGQMRVSAGDCRGGSDDFNRVVAIDPAQASAWAALGMARLCLGDAEGARRALRRAVELAPERPDLAAALTKLEATAN